MDINEVKKILLIQGLKNAVEFGGKPNKKAVMGKLMAERKDLRTQSKKIIPLLDDIINEILMLDLEQQKERLLELDPTALEKEETIEEDKELPALPDLDKFDQLVMRLAPYPSGALHIGNARMIVLNNEYVKRNNGKLILFYDDTIGSPKSLRNSPKAKYVLPEAYDLIQEGLEWLGVKIDEIYYKSDRIGIFYEYCEKLIKDDMAYVCFCDAITFREKYKKVKKECPHRNQIVSKNLEEWNNMLQGKYSETEAVVRLKTGMSQKDPALRDQIIMRISEAEHPRVDSKYIVWPMLEFSWAIDDHLLNISHIIRGIDLMKEGLIEEFVWDHFGWKKSILLYYGRLRFPHIKLSKTDSRNKIEEGIYDGWDDPRTWSLQSLKKRGIRAEALKSALLDLGMSQAGISFSVDWLYAKNKDLIDEISHRYFYVENPVKLIITKVPDKKVRAEPLLLPSNPEKGTRIITSSVDDGKLEVYLALKDVNNLKAKQIIRLKDLMNVEIGRINLKQNKVHATFHSHELNRDYSIIHWVPEEQHISVSILQPNGELSKGFGECSLAKIQMNTPIQFERYGFVNPIKFENSELFCYFTH
ncbi:MAG: glutamate--tRNA ligase [Promethearchaeota archaeon]|nr:MAG: glutamate--tRNA ligase [Candidatus Lokiarchaeota archaeon]